MRWIPHLVTSVALLAGLVSHDPALAQSGEARVIVKFKENSSALRPQLLSAEHRMATEAAALGTRVGIPLRAGSAVAERTQVMFASGMSSEALAQRLAAESDVEFAVVDRRRFRAAAPNDPRYAAGQTLITPAAGQWYLRPPDATFVSAINAQTAWDVTVGSPSVVVAVLDTGIRADHPDLAANLLAGYDMISDAPTANDGDGRDSNPADEGDWLTQTEINNNGASFNGCSTQATSSWHGTQTAGLIGALTDNNIGMASVGRTVKVVPVRVLGKCGGFDSDIIAGMRWAAGLTVTGVPANANPVHVINMSLGADGACDSAYQSAINEIQSARPGVVIVASAGNSEGVPVGSPANCNGVIAVAGLRHTGTKVGFSSMGSQVAIAAPGGNCVNAVGTCLYPILTTVNSGTTTPVSNAAGGSSYTDGADPSVGTSFSAPLVAGTAALMLSARPTLSAAEIRSFLQGTARAFPTSGGTAGIGACPTPQSGVIVDECYCTTTTCGAGMLDTNAAVRAAVNGSVGSGGGSSGGGGGGGGGGALGAHWLLALAAAAWALRRAGSRPH